MANYEGPLLQSAVLTTFKGAAAVQANGRRIMLYEIEFGQTGALASTDCQCQWDLSRFASTNTMVGTAVTLNLLDPADVAASSIFYNAISTEPPNITTAGNGLNLKVWAINQRGSYRFRALDDNDNIIFASGTSQGAELRVLSSNFTSSAVGNLSIVER
jgi:hypothetical protein